MTDTRPEIYTVHINGTKEAVWHELTRTDVRQPALWNTQLYVTELAAGASYQMRAAKGRSVNSLGEILEWDPPNRLSQTVTFTRLGDPEFVMTYDLADAAGGGVDLTLTLAQLPPDTTTTKSMTGSGGGQFIVDTLKQIVEDGRPTLSTRITYWISNPIDAVWIPKRTRAERWPM